MLLQLAAYGGLENKPVMKLNGVISEENGCVAAAWRKRVSIFSNLANGHQAGEIDEKASGNVAESCESVNMNALSKV